MKKIDFHVHISPNPDIDKSVRLFEEMCDRHGYCGVGIMAYAYGLPSDSRGYFHRCNEVAMEVKQRVKESYAFAGLHLGEDYAKQAERLMSDGFDGIKLLRGGKPNWIKAFGNMYDDELYADFFALCEEKQYPILMHVNDPEYSWDRSRAPLTAIKRGWVYDGEGYPSHQRCYEAAENVLARYPRLNIALAHMGFYSENIDRAFELMETYPNLKMDVTPALNIYEELSLIHDRAEEFFRKYSDRIIFGTDAVNNLEGDARISNDDKNEATSHFFTGEGDRIIRNKLIRPIRLTEEMLENIYYKSAMNFIGK